MTGWLEVSSGVLLRRYESLDTGPGSIRNTPIYGHHLLPAHLDT